MSDGEGVNGAEGMNGGSGMSGGSGMNGGEGASSRGEGRSDGEGVNGAEEMNGGEAACASGWRIPNLGFVDSESGFVEKPMSADGFHVAGRRGVRHILATGDGKIELIAFEDHTMARVGGEMGCPAWYPLPESRLSLPVKAVLMDLDGTTVRSEGFWIWIIERTVADILDDGGFTLSSEDMPFVSGHSVSEHLQYCIKKYAPKVSLERARSRYTKLAEREMNEITQGRGKADAFAPAPGVKSFLLSLKEMGIKIGLVTSGLYRKAWPEILSVFKTLGMGDPSEFYDCVITAGQPLGEGPPGTLGELVSKPHPWLYAEAARVGLGIPPCERRHALGIEDSGAGVCAVRLAGLYTVGVGGGNILQSGARGMCDRYCESFDDILRIIAGQADA